MTNDIDRYLFSYEFRELEAITILYRSGMLSEDQMTKIDYQFQILKENIRAIFSNPIHWSIFSSNFQEYLHLSPNSQGKILPKLVYFQAQVNYAWSLLIE